MKPCHHCGPENADSHRACRQCHAETAPAVSQEPIASQDSGESSPAAASAGEPETGLVTLMRCRTLAEADLVVSCLRGGNIEAFIPDEFLMQTVGWNLNTTGYVSVQVAPKDFAAAKENLLAP